MQKKTIREPQYLHELKMCNYIFDETIQYIEMYVTAYKF